MPDPNTNSVILVVDDEPSICWGFEKLLGDQGYSVITASSAEEGLQKAKEHSVALVLLDVRLPGEDGIQALPKFRSATEEAPVIVMTAFGDLETAVAAIGGGAVDYLTKPFRLEDAAKSCAQAMQSPFGLAEAESPEETDATLLVGQSPKMQKVFRQIALVADSDLSVLITGETGTGKELVAAAIHRHSRRRNHDYIPVAPVTFSEAVLESELFGHVKGAFTGAADDRQGLFSLADLGTVLLDEIGDLPLTAQVKLLRVIEQGEFTAVGDVRPRKCNVRVIAATNRDLSQRVSEGTFREDLLYRLSAVSIHLPPLRERVEDLPLLCRHFLRRLGHGAAAEAISPELISHLQARPWLGNVRELRNAIEHASVVARGRAFTLDDFPEPQTRGGLPNRSTSGSLDQVVEDWAREELQRSDGDAKTIDDLHERMLAATEPALLRIALEQTDGNRAAAAQLLGIHRGTLRERLKRYGSLEREDGPNSSEG